MSLAALCSRQSVRLRISAASDAAGLVWKTPQTDPDRFLAQLPTEKPRFALITSEYLSQPNLFASVRNAHPETRIVLCILPEVESQMASLWSVLDALDIEVLCTLDELSDCLTALKADRFYTSALLAIVPVASRRETLSGWHTLTPAEKRVLRVTMQGLKGPAIAAQLFLSPRTVYNHHGSICQKLSVPGGQGSLMAFIVQNILVLRELVSE